MAHIVLAWELGGGFGHLTRLQALAKELLGAGHKVTLIARHLDTAQAIFSPLFEQFRHVQYRQAPFYNGYLPDSLEQTPAYVHVLFNVGYGYPDILNRLVANWYQILCELQPDMIVADHAPTALMVSRGMAIPKINFGDGFTCPAPEYPLPQLHSSLSLAGIKADENTVLEYCNQALAVQGVSPMNQLADIYRVEETFLMTFAELDHLGSRPQVHYGGVLESGKNSHGRDMPAPKWPEASGPGIFAYLKQQDHLDSQLEAIVQTGLPALVSVPEISPLLEQKYNGCSRMTVASQPVPMGEIFDAAQLVISHGGHQLAAECLLAGVPQIHLPLHLEQQLLSHRCQQTGSSLVAHPAQLADVLPTALENLSALSDKAQQQASQLGNASAANPLGRCMALIEYWLS